MTRRRALVAGVLVAALLGLLFLRWPAGDPPVASDASGQVRTERRGAVGLELEAGAPAAPTDEASQESLDAEAEATDEELAALAAELEADPNTHVVCELSIPVRRSEGYLAIGGHSDMNGRRVQVVDGKAYLPLVYDLGEIADVEIAERTGRFSLDGYGPVALSWSDPAPDGSLGHCEAVIDPEPGMASLTGSLTLSPSGAPAAGAWVEGCGNMAFADQNGVIHMDIVAEPCSVIAMRQDGLLRTMSELVQVDPVPGSDAIVDLVIPEAPRAGLGVQVSQGDDGIVIDGLVEGGPAGEAGLMEGDRVVAIDGEPTDDLGEFVQAVGGTEGTDVTLTIDRAGEELELTVTRRVLTPG